MKRIRRKDKQLIRKSGLFDSAWYLAENRDVAEAGLEPLGHYLKYGWKDGRKPHPLFDTAWYLASNPDVAEAAIEPLGHYLKLGWQEGRNPHPLFDTARYLAENPDVEEAGHEPLAHYLKRRMYVIGSANPTSIFPISEEIYELLSPHFDEFYYQAQSKDFKNENKKLLIEHYIQTGYKLGLDPSRDFSTSYYLEHNRDIITEDVNPFVHYVKLGVNEKREPHDRILTKTYSDSTAPPVKEFKTAVCAHIYYIDLLDDVFEAVQNVIDVSQNTICYISTTSQNRHNVDKSLSDKGWNYKLITLENIGYDIYPFLRTSELAVHDNCDLICKLHTKKDSANLEDAVENIEGVWASMLIDPIAGSGDTVMNILTAFSDNEDLAMVGSAQAYKSVRHLMCGNDSETYELLKKLDPAMDFRTDAGFFAGCMFWARSSSIAKSFPLIAILEEEASGEAQKTGVYASVSHSLEHLFGFLLKIEKKHVGLSYASDLRAEHYYVEVPQNATSSFIDRASYVGVGMTLQSEYDLHDNVKALEDQLNIEPYQLNLPINLSKRDALAHFLRYGIFQKNFYPGGFDHHVYWGENTAAITHRKNPFIHSLDHPESKTLPMPYNFQGIYDILKNSEAFDEIYYRAVNQDLPNQTDALWYYVIRGWRDNHNPNKNFDSLWYINTHMQSPHLQGVNPLLHYCVLGRENKLPTLPPKPSSITKKPLEAPLDNKRASRICLFAAYDVDGLVDPSLIRYVQEISNYADTYILFDSDLEYGEIEKISPYTKGAWALRHGEYDFGSYSRLAEYYVGWETIEQYDELLLINDSSYLISSLQPVFDKMDQQSCHWWGLQATKGLYATKDLPYNQFQEKIPISSVGDATLDEYENSHLYDFLIGSYFLVFRTQVIHDKVFQGKLNSVKKEYNKLNIILNYEVGVMRLLTQLGYQFSTFIDHLYPFHPVYTNHHYDLIKEGLPLFKRYFLTNNHYKVPNLATWEERLLEIRPDAPTKEINTHLRRVANAETLYQNLHIDPEGESVYTLLTREEFIARDAELPKDNDLWVFTVSAYGHTFNGNERAVFEYIKDDPHITKVILYRSKALNDVEGVNVYTYPLKSRAGQEALLKSGYIFISHSPMGNSVYPLDVMRHKFINLWHGIPLKRIGVASLDAVEGMKREHSKLHFVIASSRIDRMAMTCAFYPLTYQDVKITGLPRNDMILKKEDRLPISIRNQITQLTKQLESIQAKKLILYAPTFRNKQADAYYSFSAHELKQLNEFLENNNAVIGIREHMADSTKSYTATLKGKNFINLNNKYFPDIEAIYRVADILITDYSSSYIDYLLTDKPVISFAFDYDDYINNERGLFYDMEMVFPGPICKEFSSLLESLEQLLAPNSNQNTAYNYEHIKKIFFDYQDDQSSKRLVDLIKSESDEIKTQLHLDGE